MVARGVYGVLGVDISDWVDRLVLRGLDVGYPYDMVVCEIQ